MDEEGILSEKLMERLLQFPIMQYACLNTDEVSFQERVRTVCETECPRYGSSWSCPPAVGSVEECKGRCRRFSHCFVFSTIAEVNDETNMEETLATRLEHERITQEINRIFTEEFGDTLALSTESCDICRHCSYPDGPCRHPDRMFPCVESYGILVTELAEKGQMDFYNGANVVTWFSVIFFK